MRTQKSDNEGMASNVLPFQATKTKDVARTTPSNAEKKGKVNPMAKMPVHKKDVKTRQSQAVLSLVRSEEEFQTRIAKRAYELYEQRGWQHGYDREDWFQAEKEVLTQQELG